MDPAAAPLPPVSPSPRRRDRPRAGSRRRRLRLTALLLTVVTVGVVALGVLAHRSSRPEVRRPGEALPQVTDRLARGLPAEAPFPALVDVTAAAGLSGFRTFAGVRTSQLPEDMGGGAAWGDFNGNGWDDLFLVAAGGPLDAPAAEWAPSLLYENMGDGTFRQVETFPDLRIIGMAAAWGDYTGDGRLDLAVSGYRALLLFRNEGDGRFVRDERFEAPDGYWAGVSWADFDGDGHLDLYVCGYVRYVEAPPGALRVSQQYGAAVPYTLNPASYEPERNLLFRNRGDGTFEEVALLWGVSDPGGRSLAALWHDLDGDGRPDLYVANDISDNALFLNRGYTFEDASHSAWVADYRGAMGLAVGDFDRDGDDDLFVTHWLAQENALYASQLRAAPPSPEEGMWGQGAGTVDALPRRLTFTDLSARLGLGAIALPLVGWGTEFADLDGDGWLDLLVANGSTLEDPASSRRLVPQRNMLFWNRQGEFFHDLGAQVEAWSTPRVGRGLALSDYDGDGALDVLVVNLDGGVQLLRNEMQWGNWLQLRLRHRLATGAWGRGEGATVVAWIGDVPLRRSVSSVSYLSQSTATLHFGLGEAQQVDALEVLWPSGEVERHGPVPANGFWELRQGEGEPQRVQRQVRSGGPAGATVETATAAGVAARPLSRGQVREFWEVQRGAMDALRRDGDLELAGRLLRQALLLDPGHEDTRYYLASLHWAQGDAGGALAELEELRRRTPGSLRAHLRWANLRALSATGDEDYVAAERAVARALEINPEDTGVLLLAAELALLRGRHQEAARRFELVCRSNPRAVGGFFLQGYVAWLGGDHQGAVGLLEQAHGARGEEGLPEGAVSEGDVRQRMHREETPLSRFWDRWDGTPDPEIAFGPLHRHLSVAPR
jgi:enediyne biosynthesis protein E4